jgi:hapalindole H/12-epi-hapalindole U/12-epi-fischerindole U synthase
MASAFGGCVTTDCVKAGCVMGGERDQRHSSGSVGRFGVACAMMLGAGVVGGVAGIADAEPIAVVNHGFEANFVGENLFAGVVPAGWSVWDPAGIVDQVVDAVGVLNPTSSTFYPGGAPEGTIISIVYLSQDRGTNRPVGLSQTLGATLQANTRYSLRVQVGNIASGIAAPPFDVFFDLDGFPGYRIELLAGGQVVAQDDNTMFATIPEGEFRESVVVVEIAEDDPRLGLALGIRLVNLNMPGTAAAPGIEVNFDDVRLDAEPIGSACDADFDGSGFVDTDDFDAFVGAFEAGDESADFDGSGFVDTDDFDAFVRAFEKGC